MVRITQDIGKNRLILEFEGRPSVAELEDIERRLREAVARLRSPFDVLSDVSRLDSLDDIPLDALQRLGNLLRHAGVRRVARVVGHSAAGALAMQRLGRFLNSSAHLAFSRSEAEAVLDAH